jgi:prephenate dehydrogenase
MTPVQMSQWFADQVKMRAYKDKYVDEKEEQQILQAAIDKGIGFDAARSALVRVCESEDYVLESVVIEKAKEALETFAGNDGKIEEKEFKDAVTIAMKASRGKKSELECKKMILKMIEEGATKIKTGWFSNWYSAARKEVGMA